MIKKIVGLLLLINSCVFSQTEVDYVNPFVYDNATYKNSIKTIQLNLTSFEFAPPILRLNSNDKLLLQFDDLDPVIRSYYYTIIHCNSDWEPTNISPSDYIDGYREQLISDYKYSFNTFNQYLHYKLEFPTDVMKPTKSGNYVLKVFMDEDQEKLVFSRRFMVVDEKVQITSSVHAATAVEYRKFKQEVDFDVFLNGYEVVNAYDDIEVMILQNNRFDNACKKLKPQFVRNEQLSYNYEDENTFWGGNEYRELDIRNLKYRAQQIESIDFDEKKNYHVHLLPDEKRSYKKYSTVKDINGDYSIRVEGSNDPELDAEYVYVHFTLPYAFPEPEGNFYVFGALSDWQCKSDYKMTYDATKKAYTAKILLKQGYYNYNYAFLSDSDKKIDEMTVEGSHFETDNSYTILVYHTTIGKFHQQLIGVHLINSVNK